jgi:flagellar protein FlbD
MRLTRRDGTPLWLNPLLLETLEETPDTVLTLTTGRRLVVREDGGQVRRSWRRSVRTLGMLTALRLEGRRAAEAAQEEGRRGRA